MPMLQRTPTPLALTLVLFALPSVAEAQRSSGSESRVRALEVGAKAGLETANNGLLLGVHARMPVDPWKRVELMPGAWVEFLDRITEYQVDADVVFMLDSRGSFYAGGGAAFRNTIYDVEQGEEGEILGDREFRTGYNLILGLRTPPGRQRGIGTQLELRWVSVDAFDLQVLSLGVNWPLVVF